MSKEEVSLEKDLVKKIKEKFGDDVDITDAVSDIVEKFFECEEAIDDIIKVSSESTSSLSELTNLLSKSKDSIEKFKTAYTPQITPAQPLNVDSNPPIGGKNSAIKKAKVFSRKPAEDGDMTTAPAVVNQSVRNPNVVAENRGINPSPQPQTVRIGMGSQQAVKNNNPTNKAAPLNTEGAKTPSTPVKNQLVDGDESSIDPTAKQQLESMREGQSKTVSHPSGCVGPDMGKEVMIQPGQGFSQM